MPIPALKGYALKSGKTIEQVETIWDKAKYDAKGKFNVKPGDKPPAGYWPYVMTLVKQRCGLTESFKDFSESYDEIDFNMPLDRPELPEMDFDDYSDVTPDNEDITQPVTIKSAPIELWISMIPGSTSALL